MKSINPDISRSKSSLPNLDGFKAGIEKGDKTMLAKAITLVESTRTANFDTRRKLLEWASQSPKKPSYRIGITGVPGAGKSTLIEVLGLELIEKGHKVAVLAIDPSSQKTHGSILGDKTRMVELGKEQRAFIRPSAAGKTLGGVTAKTREAVVLCEAAGFDIILIETVGVGQSEISVKQMVDFFLLVLVAGAGDELQGIKRGIVEMADLILINKADGENIKSANASKVEYNRAIGLFPTPPSGVKPRVATCSALTLQGIDNVWKFIFDYFQKVQNNNFFDVNRKNQAVDWMKESLNNQLLEAFYHNQKIKAELNKLLESVRKGHLHPIAAANKLIDHFKVM